MANRQSGKLHNLHIRIKEADYERIVEICDKLGITIAEYFNTLLQDDGYEKLQMYAKTIKNQPRPIEVSFKDKETCDRVQAMTNAADSAAQQTRKIGINLSTLIRDIRNGKVSAERVLSALQQTNGLIQMQMKMCNAVNANLEKLLYSDEGIQKTEIRYKEGGY